MTAIGSSYTIDYQAYGDYRVQAGTGATETMTESQVNALLSSGDAGFRHVRNGDMYLQSGERMSDAASHAVNSLGGAPPLPGVSGKNFMPVADLGSRLSSGGWSSTEVSHSAWAALSEIARSGFTDRRTSRELRLALQSSKASAKKMSIEMTKKKIEAEKDAAWERFGWAIAGTVISAVTAGAGASMGVTTATGAGLTAASQGLGTIATSFGDAASKEWGAQSEAHEAEIRAKELDLHAERLDSAIEDAKANEQEAKEAAMHGLKLLEQITENRTQAVQKLTNI